MDDIDQWVQAIVAGERRALARAITLIESERPSDGPLAAKLLAALPQPKTHAKRIGISGTPGVGKSTLIEALGQVLLSLGHRVAVLAIDPTSPVAGGSILGDKTRMQHLATAPDAYVRPSAARGFLGGIGLATPEAIELCEAAGYDIVLVESVGVGQSEYSTALATDCFVLMVQPHAGDELQVIKRGVLELGDVIVVNKADGPTETEAQKTTHMLKQSLGQIRPHHNTPVVTTSALSSSGLDELWKTIEGFFSNFNSETLQQRRRERLLDLWYQTMPSYLWQTLQADPQCAGFLATAKQSIVEGSKGPLTAARHLYQQLFKAT